MRLSLSAFVAGFVTLGLEVTSLRLLAPTFGASLLVFSNVVGVILAGLAAGYALGGRLADRRPEPKLAGRIQLAAGVLVLLLPALSQPFLEKARAALEGASVSVFLWSLAAVTLLVLPPTVLLGMLTPFLVRLRTKSANEAGRASGGLFAVSTAGSLLGTFVPTLLTIPFFGTAATLYLLGGLLVLGSLLLLGRAAAPALALPFLLSFLPRRHPPEPGVLLERDSQYQHIRVEEKPDGTRLLLVNEGLAVQSTFVPGARLSGTMYDAFLLLDAAKDGGIATLADLGLAGGTIAHAFQLQKPSVKVTGVELDPDVIAVGKQHFTLTDPNLAIVNCDGRLFLETTRARFDAIAVDVFRQPHVPFTFTTREFFALAQSRLHPGGALMMNVAAISRDDVLLTRILDTVASVFRETWVYHPPRHENWLVLASDTPGLDRRLRRNPVPADIEPVRREVAAGLERVRYDPARPVFTDDRAPSELYSDLLFLRFLAKESKASAH
jgi:spermidine synthase